MSQIRPMLAAKFNEDITRAHIAQDGMIYVQPKIDGMRVCFDSGIARSRSWKPHGNKYLQTFASLETLKLEGLDGEVISGLVNTPEVFRESMSGIRAQEGSPDFTVYVFDYWDARKELGYSDRLEMLAERWASEGNDWNVIGRQDGVSWHAKLVYCPTYIASSIEEVYKYETELLAAGWEGAILRRRASSYKWNRATPLGGELTKLKRFEDDEAVVIGYEPRYHNLNEPTQSALGYTTRSSHQENLQAEECLGALEVQLLGKPDTSFKIGVFRGLDYSDKCRLWTARESLIGRIAKFKHQGYGGGYDVPRTPVFIGWRDPVDV